MRRSLLQLSAMLSLLSAPASSALAEPELRLQVDQHGDFLLIGNTLAQECDASDEPPPIPAPIVGTLGACPEISPSAPDIYYRVDDPSAGVARADASFSAKDARSTAVLRLPSDAKVTYARLYWGAYAADSSPDAHARIERAALGFGQDVTADRLWAVRETPSDSGRYWYQAAADVTSIVAAQGAGPYRVGGIASVELASLRGDPYGYAAWYLVVFFERAAEPQRNLSLFEGLDLVQPEQPTTVGLSGFLVPPRELGTDAKLGVVAFEGDANIDGDGLRFGNEPLSDALNPVDNFFNGTRSMFGQPVSVVGDLPQLSGTARSMSGIDLDVLDITSLVRAGQTDASLTASSTRDTFLLGAFVTAFSTLKPSFQRSLKTVRGLDGAVPRPGDELLYTLQLVNTGSDASLRTTLRDALPNGVSYVPESIEIKSGAGAGRKTDAAGDDSAEYDAVMRSVVVRLGQGADAELGGSLAINEQVIVQFRVRVEPGARGSIRNQALISAAGEHGAIAEDTRTDSDLTLIGAQSTDILINVCDSSEDCSAARPLCDLTLEPGACVACTSSADCQEPDVPDCSTQDHLCECAAGPGACRVDSDHDGMSDSAEKRIGSDPHDADSDDDGTLDGAELSPEVDSDGDGLINVLDADSDDDGLFDGTEQGFGCGNPDTDLTRKRCRPDADGGETTSHPLRRDTDRGGISDGSEDWNLDGKRDPDESQPGFGHAQDDKARDSDDDGLSDELEETLHSDPQDADSDDDGVPDGSEHNPAEDSDGDGLINVLDADSDDDGLFDGTEQGRSCDARGTDVSQERCIADADSGQSKTCALRVDTDRGGVCDGAEDRNHNGRVDHDERDPNDASDDGTGEPCMAAAKGGGQRMSPAQQSSDGGAPDAAAASEQDAGSRTAGTGTITSAATQQAADAGIGPDGRLYGGGCSCRVLQGRSAEQDQVAFGLISVTVTVTIARRRRQRRKPHCKA